MFSDTAESVRARSVGRVGDDPTSFARRGGQPGPADTRREQVVKAYVMEFIETFFLVLTIGFAVRVRHGGAVD